MKIHKNPSREYLASLSIAERKKLASKFNIRQEFLYQVGRGDKSLGRALALKMEILTKGKVKESDFDTEIRVSLNPQRRSA